MEVEFEIGWIRRQKIYGNLIMFFVEFCIYTYVEYIIGMCIAFIIHATPVYIVLVFRYEFRVLLGSY